MDNKITKKRINDHMEYDWFKYIIILIASIVLVYFVFSQINSNRDYETIDLFVSSYASYGDNHYADKTKIAMNNEMDAKYGENVVREVNLNNKNPLEKDYGSLVMTQGMQSSDILILPLTYLEDGGANGFVELTDELLTEYLLPKDVSIDELEYYETENTETGVKTRRAIRVDRFAKMSGKTTGVYEMDWKQIDAYKDKDWGENPPPTEFYMLINPNSVSIGKFGKKAKVENVHALYCAQLFIDFYRT